MNELSLSDPYGSLVTSYRRRTWFYKLEPVTVFFVIPCAIWFWLRQEKGMDVYFWLMLYLLMLVLILPGLLWRIPARITLLRPFGAQEVSSALQQFVGKNLAGWGHAITLSDTYIKYKHWFRSYFLPGLWLPCIFCVVALASTIEASTSPVLAGISSMLFIWSLTSRLAPILPAFILFPFKLVLLHWIGQFDARISVRNIKGLHNLSRILGNTLNLNFFAAERPPLST